MPAYFDSSFLLSILLDEKNAPIAAELWEKEEERVSSILLQAECVTVIRRIAKIHEKKFTKKWVEEKLSLLNLYLDEIEIKTIDSSILSFLLKEEALSQCRTLDALHLATALFFRDFADNFAFCTFDRRMAEFARSMNFILLPKNKSP